MEIALEKLPLNERVRLVQTLWDSIVADNPSAEGFPLTDAQKKLIDERLANMTMGVADKPKKKRQAGTAKGKAVFADDFDAPLEDFQDYM